MKLIFTLSSRAWGNSSAGGGLALREDLSLIPNTFVTKPGVVVCACHPSAGDGAGEFLGPSACPASLMEEYQDNEESCHRESKGGRTPEE